MKSKILIITLAGVALSVSCFANATLITFDESFAHNSTTNQSPPHSDGTVSKYTTLNEQYEHLGVIFGGDWRVVDSDQTFGEDPISGKGFAAFNSPNNILSMSFTDNINSISGYIGGGLYDSSYADMTWSVTALLKGKNIVEKTYISNASHSGGGYVFFDLSFEKADTVKILGNPRFPVAGSPAFSGLMENLSFAKSTPVPEPSTLAIFALSLIGLASRQFKKK